MRVVIVTLFPDLVRSVLAHGILGRAIGSGLLHVDTANPRDYTHDRHRTADDRPYGGGPGMVLKAEPTLAAIRAARAGMPAPRVLLMSPQGRVLTQAAVQRLAQADALVLVAGRYEGVDERVVQLAIDEEWSIGDYVLSGGELPALVLLEAVSRLLPGALGDSESAHEDSFSDGVLDCPHYTRPEQVEGLPVPPVLLSGDHAAIRRWRRRQALGRTWQRRPELIARRPLSRDDALLLDEFLNEHGDSVPDAKVQR